MVLKPASTSPTKFSPSLAISTNLLYADLLINTIFSSWSSFFILTNYLLSPQYLLHFFCLWSIHSSFTRSPSLAISLLIFWKYLLNLNHTIKQWGIYLANARLTWRCCWVSHSWSWPCSRSDTKTFKTMNSVRSTKPHRINTIHYIGSIFPDPPS